MIMIGLLDILSKYLSDTKNVYHGSLNMINVGFLCSTAWDILSLNWFKEVVHLFNFKYRV